MVCVRLVFSASFWSLELSSALSLNVRNIFRDAVFISWAQVVTLCRYTCNKKNRCVYTNNVKTCSLLMKTGSKKVLRNFRIRADIEAELRKRSQKSGLPQTRIVEDALVMHFAKTMGERLKKLAADFAGRPTPPALSNNLPFMLQTC